MDIVAGGVAGEREHLPQLILSQKEQNMEENQMILEANRIESVPVFRQSLK